MKTLNTLFFIISILAATLLLIPSHSYEDPCAPTEIPLTTEQHTLLASNVFVGRVTSIKNDTAHQWNVHFSIEKLWKGTAGQSLTVTTNELQRCRYSITTGEKYLVYTNGFPPWLQTSWTKPYADAQNDMALLNNPNFQAQEKAKEELNRKLEVAKVSISNMMGSKMSPIPINMVSVDVLNSTLDVGIDSAKAKLSKEKYQEKLREIVGNIPIKISFGQYFALPDRLADNSTRTGFPSIMSPLKQFKSGIAVLNIVCKEGLQLIIKSEDESPICVKPQTGDKLVARGWAHGSSDAPIAYFMKSNSIAKISVKYDSGQSDVQTNLNARIYNSTTMYQISPIEIEATVNPSVIPAHTNTSVVYTIMSHETRGLFWLSLDACSFMPIAIDLDNSSIEDSDLQPPINGWRCPVSLLHYKIVDGLEGITPEYLRLR